MASATAKLARTAMQSSGRPVTPLADSASDFPQNQRVPCWTRAVTLGGGDALVLI
ncbi:hypothetical protein PQR08_30890 [Caballeronia jiangsuensis]|uniref:Uncharacterized protein n=1 Tax=Caballeronia jiangsuensis TaxID=1458357 RepID=A0ABW9CWV4_9BURK